MPPRWIRAGTLALAESRRGNVAIVAAASLPIMLGALALGVDWGYVGYQKRDAQTDTDLAAISAASDPASAAAILRDYVERHGLGLTVMEETAYHAQQPQGVPDGQGILTYRLGRYTPDETVSHGERFAPAETPYNAVRVRMHKQADLAFAASLVAPPRIATQAIAGTEGIAAFSIGSRLASLNGGVLNAVLGQLLGSDISLSVMDYRALLDADIDLLSFLDAAATSLHVQAASYDELLNSRLSLPQLLGIVADTPGLTGTVRSLVDRLAGAAADDRTLVLGKLLDLGNAAGGLTARVGVLDLVSAAAAIAGGERQVDVDLGTKIPGLAAVSVKLLVGEPPVGGSWFAVGPTGTIVRTAQTRLRIDAGIGGSGLLAGIRINLPIYIELAYAEGQLAGITCSGTSPDNATVDVAARPGVAEAWIAETPEDIAGIGANPTFAPAGLVDVTLLKVRGYAHAEIGNPRPQTLRFTPNDIREGRVLSTSTSAYVGPLLSSLIGDLRLDISLLRIPLVGTAIVQKAVASILATAVQPLDSVVYNVLLALGVRIGEADVQVTGVRCGRPVLVQ